MSGWEHRQHSKDVQWSRIGSIFSLLLGVVIGLQGILGSEAKSRRHLTDVRVSSKRQQTKIVLLLDGPVQIEQGEAPALVHRNLPPRLFLDLSPCTPLRRWRRTFSVNDPRVSRIRIARNTLQRTRVVIDLKRSLRSRVTVLSEPLRIVIEVGKLPFRPSSLAQLPRRRPKLEAAGSVVPAPVKRRRRWASAKPYVLRYKGSLKMPYPFQIRTIAIDPGHGGKEEGAVGRDTGLQEKVVTLDISKRVIRLVQRRLKVKAFLTRTRDVSMSIRQRAALIKKKKADILVSIHINAHPSRRLQGLSTYILHWNDRFRASRLLASDPLFARENQGVHLRMFRDVDRILNGLLVQNNAMMSRLLAVAIQRDLLKSVRGSYKVRDLGVRRGLFYLLFAAGIPGVIVESSFLSNRYEEKLLRSSRYRQKIANGIANGIISFVRLSQKQKRGRR